ncbi:MAG: 30S ribosomal protein S18 [Chloroflexota bacterium]
MDERIDRNDFEEEEREFEPQERYTGRRFYRPRVCPFCVDKDLPMDYKNVEVLQRFVSEDGRIRPRRHTGTCSKHQRKLAREVKRARHLALLPFTGETLR